MYSNADMACITFMPRIPNYLLEPRYGTAAHRGSRRHQDGAGSYHRHPDGGLHFQPLGASCCIGSHFPYHFHRMALWSIHSGPSASSRAAQTGAARHPSRQHPAAPIRPGSRRGQRAICRSSALSGPSNGGLGAGWNTDCPDSHLLHGVVHRVLHLLPIESSGARRVFARSPTDRGVPLGARPRKDP